VAGRRLDADEQALWRRVIATVRPIAGRRVEVLPGEPADSAEPRRPHLPPVAAPAAMPVARPIAPGETLDGGWDRRLARGAVAPDRSIDLHGHTLASAHAALDAELGMAVAAGDRLVLVVAGRARPGGDGGFHPDPVTGARRRGAIRASIGDWLAGSRHAGAIAAVRNAHPRHGGGGALYIVLRRRR